MFGRLFGTDKAIESIIDKDNGLLSQAGSWVGGLNYTDEEKSESAERTRAWGLKQLDAIAPFKIVQRILAFAATFVWIMVAINVVAAIWVEAATSGSVDAVKPLLEFSASDYIFWPIVTVYALYFGGGAVESIKRKLR